MLSESLSTRRMSVREYELGLERRRIDRAKLERQLGACTDEIDRESLNLDAEKLSMHAEVGQADYEYALHEIETLRDLLARLEPHCMWATAKLTRQEGYQLAQREERRQVLLERARLSLLSQGMLDTETLREMRSHPDALALESSTIAMVEAMKTGTLRLADRQPLLMLEENNGTSKNS